MNKYESKYFNTARRMDDALVSLLLEKEFEYITIKEICARAAVNRSTFYLHYENTADMLAETVEMTRERFLNSVSGDDTVQSAIENAPAGDLFFITDQRLLPYLNFIRENRHIYKAIHTQMDIFGVERAYSQLFQNVFSPVLSKYGVAEEKHDYIMTFYRQGLVAVIMKWVEADCRESAAEIAGIIKQCIAEPPQ